MEIRLHEWRHISSVASLDMKGMMGMRCIDVGTNIFHISRFFTRKKNSPAVIEIRLSVRSLSSALQCTM